MKQLNRILRAGLSELQIVAIQRTGQIGLITDQIKSAVIGTRRSETLSDRYLPFQNLRGFGRIVCGKPRPARGGGIQLEFARLVDDEITDAAAPGVLREKVPIGKIIEDLRKSFLNACKEKQNQDRKRLRP